MEGGFIGNSIIFFWNFADFPDEIIQFESLISFNEPEGMTMNQINNINAFEWKNLFTLEKSNEKKIVLKKNTTVCSVCMYRLQEGEIVRKLKCGHYFHKECIDKWLGQNASCPLDRLKAI